MEISLKYGCNPHQTPAGVTVPEEAGFQVLSGRPGYINFLDALGAWQLVRELKAATGKPAAASFKHVSPAGAAVAGELSAAYRASQFLGDEDYSPLATAYARARGGDRMCSFGDVAAVSDVVDLSLARLLYSEVSDLIIAPGFEPEALELLKTKRDGAYMVLSIDPEYEPADVETREVFGFTMTQKRNTTRVTPELFQTAGAADADASVAPAGAPLPADVLETLIVATVALKYTQSNSVGIACDGQVIGMGAGQQSRVHCTRLACGKADKWLLQQHPKTLALPIREDLPKPEKANLVDYYLLWDELSGRGEAQAPRGPDGRSRPAHAGGARRVGQTVQRHLPQLRRLHPVPRQPRPRRQEQRAVRRPDRRLGTRRRGERRGGRVRDDDGAHGAAAVPALAQVATPKAGARTAGRQPYPPAPGCWFLYLTRSSGDMSAPPTSRMWAACRPARDFVKTRVITSHTTTTSAMPPKTTNGSTSAVKSTASMAPDYHCNVTLRSVRRSVESARDRLSSTA